MTIKSTKYKQVERAIDISLARLRDGSNVENLPVELKDKINNLMAEFKEHDFSEYLLELKVLTGSILTEEEAKAIIIDSSGYNKWIADLDSEREWPKASYFAKTYGVSVKEEEIKPYMFFRKTNNRDDIFLVTMLCLPGFAYVSVDTDRADGDLGGLVDNEGLIAALDKHF